MKTISEIKRIEKYARSAGNFNYGLWESTDVTFYHSNYKCFRNLERYMEDFEEVSIYVLLEERTERLIGIFRTKNEALMEQEQIEEEAFMMGTVFNSYIEEIKI